MTAFMLLLNGISVGETKHKRERGFIHVMSVTRLSILCQRLTSIKFGSTARSCVCLQRVVARSSTQTTASTETKSLCVASHTIERAFATSPCWARTTIIIKEIILNLNMSGKEERKRTVLASLRKQADFCYHLNCKSIVLIFNIFFRLYARFVQANLS